MMLRLGHHHTVDENARYLDLPRVERAVVRYSFDLRDDQTAGVACRHGDRKYFEGERFLFHGDVAVGIGGRAANDADVDGECAIEKQLLTVNLDQANEVLLGAFVDLAAAVTRVDKRSEADAREVARALGSDVAEQMGDDTLGKIVPFDLVGDCQTLQLRHEPPVSADDAPHQAYVAEMIEPAVFSVSLACGVDQRQIAWLANRRGVLHLFREMKRLQRHGNLFGETDTDETTRRDRVAVAYQANCLLGRDDLAAFPQLQGGR